MTWYAWAMVGWFLLGAGVTVLYVGKPRKPIEPATALVSVVVTALIIWGIVSLAAR